MERNISISKVNGYTLEKVLKAKEYLEEIGNNKRTFDFKRLVEMYNDVLGRNEQATGCKCQAPKYYNGIQNYYTYGKLTLINNGIAKEEDFEIKEEVPTLENEENRINLGSVEQTVAEDKPFEQPTVIDDKPKKSVGRPKKVKE